MAHRRAGPPVMEDVVEQSGMEAPVDAATEARAVMSVVQALSGLDAAAVARVLDWAIKRYAGDGARTVAAPSREGRPASPDPRATAEHDDDLAALYEAVSPITESESVLVAAYWHQVVQGVEHLDSQSLNAGLKNLGHGVGNVTRACSSLMRQKPALMMQVRKSGSTKQARKRYRLTAAGIQRIREMLTAGAAQERSG